ncbi:hypothetical protein RhiirA4_530060 [Rhizophagus irregularis]|uniref:Uncharacterized protein n=1 Tax=Rhizophagus irregularis TaxID=588596 RepID=A0A2I1G073_9GLOM|nr:hypothetical protein RhiirA4_530060 [Rhizophagus irregularis]
MWKWISKIGVFRVSNGNGYFFGIFCSLLWNSLGSNGEGRQLCSSGIYIRVENLIIFFLTKQHILLGSLNMWNFDGQFRKFKTSFKKKVSKLGWVLGCSEKK